MNIFITVIIIFVLIYLILNWFARTSSKKIANSIRFFIIAFSLVLAAIFFLVGRYAFSIPVLFLLIPLLKLKGLTFFQLLDLRAQSNTKVPTNPSKGPQSAPK